MKRDDLGGVSERELERLVRDKTPLRIEQTARAALAAHAAGCAGAGGSDRRGVEQARGHRLRRVPDPSGAPARATRCAREARAAAGERTAVRPREDAQAPPGADEDAEFDPAVREAWLERVLGLCEDAPPAFNSLKASVLYRRLDHDRKKGVYDRERFLEYLKLPRRTGYMHPR